jgi:hypothetical protein
MNCKLARGLPKRMGSGGSPVFLDWAAGESGPPPIAKTDYLPAAFADGGVPWV